MKQISLTYINKTYSSLGRVKFSNYKNNMRFLLVNSLKIIFIFFLVITTSIAKEEDGWILEDRDEYIMLSKNGEIIHGDKLRFAMYFDNCEKVHHLFSFLTTKNKSDIYQIEKRKLPITLNNTALTADVIYVGSVLNNQAHWVMFELGRYETREYLTLLSGFIQENEQFEIVLADGLNFEAEEYFDITRNNWILKDFNSKFSEAYTLCKEKSTHSES